MLGETDAGKSASCMLPVVGALARTPLRKESLRKAKLSARRGRQLLRSPVRMRSSCHPGASPGAGGLFRPFVSLLVELTRPYNAGRSPPCGTRLAASSSLSTVESKVALFDLRRAQQLTQGPFERSTFA